MLIDAQIRFNQVFFCRSVPPELLRSFLMKYWILLSKYWIVVEQILDICWPNIGYLLNKLGFFYLQAVTGELTTISIWGKLGRRQSRWQWWWWSTSYVGMCLYLWWTLGNFEGETSPLWVIAVIWAPCWKRNTQFGTCNALQKRKISQSKYYTLLYSIILLYKILYS